MRMSNFYYPSLREAPAEAQTATHQLLLRAGYIRQFAAGVYSYLPLARRSLNKIEKIIREEINAIGGQEITMPVVLPADIWKESGRWDAIGAEMGRFKDRNERDMVLAMTHEEAIADLIRKDIHSHKQLPLLLYHIQTKWRDDPRPRAGLIRVREFTMKDSYSLDKSWEGLEQQYRAHYQAYFNIYNRCGLPVIAVKSDTGMMGGQMAHEYMYLNPIGEDTLLLCDHCGYSANRQIARFRKTLLPRETQKSIEKIATPGVKTIADLAAFLGIPEQKTAKAVFMTAEIVEGAEIVNRLVMAIVRGDMELNETKLTNLTHARDLRPATEEEILASGAVPGYASPVGLKNVWVVVDDAIPEADNLVAGANVEGYHLLNVNYNRDYQTPHVADIVAAQEGNLCIECGQPLRAERGIEVGNIFKLGDRYSKKMGCYFQDEDRETKPVIMGSYGIGVGRLLGCLAEHYHDEAGLALPISVAPFQVHLIGLIGRESSETKTAADNLYHKLKANNIDVLYDDREDSPGVKFKDADLIGLPIRLTVSQRSLEAGGVELKLRSQSEKSIIPSEMILGRVQQIIKEMESRIEQNVVSVPYST
jgi:prolyl-tRNA synthetase